MNNTPKLIKGLTLVNETLYSDGSAYDAEVKYYGKTYYIKYYNHEWVAHGGNGCSTSYGYTPQWQKKQREKTFNDFFNLKQLTFTTEWLNKHQQLYAV